MNLSHRHKPGNSPLFLPPHHHLTPSFPRPGIHSPIINDPCTYASPTDSSPFPMSSPNLLSQHIRASTPPPSNIHTLSPTPSISILHTRHPTPPAAYSQTSYSMSTRPILSTSLVSIQSPQKLLYLTLCLSSFALIPRSALVSSDAIVCSYSAVHPFSPFPFP